MSRLALLIALPLVLGGCFSVPERIARGTAIDPTVEPFSHVTGERADESWETTWGIPFLGPRGHQEVNQHDGDLALTQGTSTLLGLTSELDAYRYTTSGIPISAVELETLGFFLLYGHVGLYGSSAAGILDMPENKASLDDQVDIHLGLLGIGHASFIRTRASVEGQPSKEGLHLTLLGLLAFTHIDDDEVDTRILLGLLGGGHDDDGDFLRFLFFKIPLGDGDES